MLLLVAGGLSNTNRLVANTSAIYIVIICMSINMLGKRLYRDTRPPDVAG